MGLMPTMQECSPEHCFGVRRSLSPLLGAMRGAGGRLLKTSERSRGCKPFQGFTRTGGLGMRVWLGREARPLALGLPLCGNCLLCCFGLSGVEDRLACHGSRSMESLPAAMHKSPSLQPGCCYAVKSFCH